MEHVGIYCTNTTNKKKLIQRIKKNYFSSLIGNINNLQGGIYSSITIDNFIEEEYKHGSTAILSEFNKSFEALSSGQQRMALANFIFKKKPDYVILDDVYSNVDKKTITVLNKLLNKNAATSLYIQLFSRVEDILPQVSQVIEIDDSLQIYTVLDKENFLLKEVAKTSKKSEYNFSHLLSKTPYFNPLVTMKNITVAYDDKMVLNKVNWTIMPGEFWEIRGPIGSGKSTLLSIIIGDNPKAFGQDLQLFGFKKGSGESVWDLKKYIGYFYPKMMQLFNRRTSIEDMIISGFYDSIGLYVQPTNREREIVKYWLNNLGFSNGKLNIHDLPLGQQRIILVFRAIIKQPPLIILDEPTVGLDADNAKLFISVIKAIAKTKKIAILYVSHRKEKGLEADYVLELIPAKYGSISKITKK